MKFSEISIDFFENTSSEPAFLHGIIRLNAGARIVKSTIRGPLFLNKNSQIGPDVVTGKYFGMNENCFVARATVGSFGAIGARTSINPFNHPTSWLSTNEFQYHPKSFDWVDEYNDFVRLERRKNRPARRALPERSQQRLLKPRVKIRRPDEQHL